MCAKGSLQTHLVPDFKLSFFSPVAKGPTARVQPPPLIAEKGAKHREYTLVEYFLGRKIPFYLIQSIALRVWKIHGILKVLGSKEGFFYFQFASSSNLDAILAKP